MHAVAWVAFHLLLVQAPPLLTVADVCAAAWSRMAPMALSVDPHLSRFDLIDFFVAAGYVTERWCTAALGTPESDMERIVRDDLLALPAAGRYRARSR